MKQSVFQEYLKECLNHLSYHTISEILEADPQHNKDAKNREDAELAFNKVCSELTKQQESIITEYIRLKDAENSEYASASYAAGLKDMISILKYFRIIKDEDDESIVDSILDNVISNKINI